MKSPALLLPLLLLTPSLLASTTTIPLRLITYNIRYATTSPSTGEQPWAVRRPLMASQLTLETANRPESLICMQEVLVQQLDNLQSDLGSAWTHIGVGRDDGAAAGEFSPLWYQPAVWAVQANRTYWLSPTPDVVGSKGWDAALPRIVTVARLKHRATGAGLVAMCTHFDHVGQTAREESAKLLLKAAGEWGGDGSGTTTTPVVLGGDLNVQPDNKAYLTLVGGDGTAAGAMKDIKNLVPSAKWYGNNKTFTGFTAAKTDDTRIDYLFVRDPLASLKFLSYGVLSNVFDDGVYISDHRPVVVDAVLATGKA
ncbi:Endonuclease/exonuclease/phosphatase [Bombardia bombarda]|uniref:Endonuclease/exonuclease/phosphatase n=1 Tax=Bombardia bombarda TaxID=252184 RepID=A0AA40C9J8_9PEZI|nr:Endonuclease/exonuclease/phosphatase [Bombardia bombarda]